MTGSEWVIASMSQTTAGVWVANLVVHRLPENCDVWQLGATVIESLEASQTGVTHPTDWKDFQQKYTASLSIKSINRFEQASRLISVELDDRKIVLIPNKHLGSRKGFEPLTNTIDIDGVDPALIGDAIRQCLGRCG
jgi:hypothetical protein